VLGRFFEVRIAPRRDRKGKIVGARGQLVPAKHPWTARPKANGSNGHDRSKTGRRYSLKSAALSLDLAKAVADSARIQSEIRMARAVEQERHALEAQLRAEAEERRARLLADASAVLDESFELRENLERLGRILVHRIGDWCVIHTRDGDLMRRLTFHHRQTAKASHVALAFPEEDEGLFFRMIVHGKAELFSSLAPTDYPTIVPSEARIEALKGLEVQSIIRVPIRLAGRTIGMLTLGSSDAGRFYDVSDLRLAEGLAHRMALSYESVRLYQEAQREITLRKEVETRMRTLNQDLERRVQERTALLEEAMREANSFAYTVAHDLRAPLRAITGFCQALKEDYSTAVDPTGQEYLERIVTGARKMDELIRDLLDYARLNREEIRKTYVDLDQILDEVLQQMSGELEERKANVRLEKPLGKVVGHGPILARVFTNLLSNSAKFVAPGVVPSIRVRSENHSIRTRIFIEDNGIGIAKEHQERIFGIFERLNRAEEYPGTGIGLAIVRRALERLGGAIGVESQENNGATFWVELPSA